ncbi:hypothetical protein VTK56DRAFT_6814 [Thermocarpiscus australiensis]
MAKLIVSATLWPVDRNCKAASKVLPLSCKARDREWSELWSAVQLRATGYQCCHCPPAPARLNSTVHCLAPFPSVFPWWNFSRFLLPSQLHLHPAEPHDHRHQPASVSLYEGRRRLVVWRRLYAVAKLRTRQSVFLLGTCCRARVACLVVRLRT